MHDVRFTPYTVAKGEMLFHLFTQKRLGNGFNDSGLGSRRFDPITFPDGSVVPTYYAAFSDLVAMQETIIRLNNNDEHTLTWLPVTQDIIDNGDAQCVAQTITTQPLNLIDLETLMYGPDNRTIIHLLRQGEAAYPMLRNIAKGLIYHFPDFNGLIWHSYQRGNIGERAMVLWGHKVSSNTLTVQLETPLSTKANLDRLKDAMLSVDAPFPAWMIR